METKHFKDHELACKCCGINDVRESSLLRMERVRQLVKKPFTFNSAYRCPIHEAAVDGSFGAHPLGAGFDVRCSGTLYLQIFAAALKCGFTGYGSSQKLGTSHHHRFLHLDDLTPNETDKPRPWGWSY